MILDRGSRFKLRDSRLVDAGPGLLGMVARSRSNRVEGVGRWFGVAVARTEGGDGKAEAVKRNFVWVMREIQVPVSNPKRSPNRAVGMTLLCESKQPLLPLMQLAFYWTTKK